MGPTLENGGILLQKAFTPLSLIWLVLRRVSRRTRNDGYLFLALVNIVQGCLAQPYLAWKTTPIINSYNGAARHCGKQEKGRYSYSFKLIWHKRTAYAFQLCIKIVHLGGYKTDINKKKLERSLKMGIFLSFKPHY